MTRCPAGGDRLGRALLVVMLLAGSPASSDAQGTTEPAHDHGAEVSAGASVAAADERIPPSTSAAPAALDRSPRHGEWVSIANEGGPVIKSWVVYPERSDKAPVVLVIHANTGLNDWTRALADQLAEDGFIAIAPDLLSGRGPNGGATDAMPSVDAARAAIATLDSPEVVRRLAAVHAYARTIPSSNGMVASMGFCWGGGRSFDSAAAEPSLRAAIVFYGTPPASLVTVKAPVLGLYAGDDARVNATIEPTAAEMRRLGKRYEYEIFEGAGHGFAANQGDRDGANLRAIERAWPRALAFLREHLR